MDLIGSANLQQAIRDIQTYPEYQNVLRVLLKHEISTLLHRLSEAGEESVVMIASVSDGALSVIGSNFGEQFVLEPGNETNLVSGFKEKFAEYCCKSRASAPKRRKRYDHGYRVKTRSPPSYLMDGVTKEKDDPVIQCRQETINVGSPLLNGNNLDDSDKAIDETVSQLVKNIFKESEEREREHGESDCGTRRRRRRRRTLSDHMKRENQYRYEQCYRRKETKIAQFFPTISQKCIEYRSSQDEGSNKQQDMYLTDIKIKLEPDTDEVSDTNNMSVGGSQEKNKIEERHSNPICEIVSNSVDKSIQKIIEMETRNPSDNESCEQDQKSDGTFADDGKIRHGDGTNMKIKQETSTMSDTENGVEMMNELDNKKLNETSDTDSQTNSLNTVLDSKNSEYVYSSQKAKDNQVDQMNRSFEESSAEDYPDDASALKKKQKRSFIHNGFSYIRDKAGKGNTVYWKCGKIGCKGRVIQRGGEKIRTQDHNHNPFTGIEDDKTDTTNTLYQ